MSSNDNDSEYRFVEPVRYHAGPSSREGRVRNGEHTSRRSSQSPKRAIRQARKLEAKNQKLSTKMTGLKSSMRDMVLTVDEQADTIEKLQRVKTELEELIAEKDAYAHDLHDEIDDLKRLMQDDAEAFRTRVQAMQAEFRRRLTAADLETKSEVDKERAIWQDKLEQAESDFKLSRQHIVAEHQRQLEALAGSHKQELKQCAQQTLLEATQAARRDGFTKDEMQRVKLELQDNELKLKRAKAAYSELERELKRTQDLLQSAQLLGRDKDTKLRAAQGELLAQVAAARQEGDQKLNVANDEMVSLRRRIETLEQSEQSAHKQVQQLHHQIDSERTAAHQKLQQELQRTDDHWTAKYDAKVRQLESQLDSTQRERDQWAAAARVAEDKVAQCASSEQSVATNYETALSRLHSERDAAASAMATAHANEIAKLQALHDQAMKHQLERYEQLQDDCRADVQQVKTEAARDVTRFKEKWEELRTGHVTEVKEYDERMRDLRDELFTVKDQKHNLETALASLRQDMHTQQCEVDEAQAEANAEIERLQQVIHQLTESSQKLQLRAGKAVAAAAAQSVAVAEEATMKNHARDQAAERLKAIIADLKLETKRLNTDLRAETLAHHEAKQSSERTRRKLEGAVHQVKTLQAQLEANRSVIVDLLAYAPPALAAVLPVDTIAAARSHAAAEADAVQGRLYEGDERSAPRNSTIAIPPRTPGREAADEAMTQSELRH